MVHGDIEALATHRYLPFPSQLAHALTAVLSVLKTGAVSTFHKWRLTQIGGLHADVPARMQARQVVLIKDLKREGAPCDPTVLFTMRKHKIRKQNFVDHSNSPARLTNRGSQQEEHSRNHRSSSGLVRQMGDCVGSGNRMSNGNRSVPGRCASFTAAAVRCARSAAHAPRTHGA